MRGVWACLALLPLSCAAEPFQAVQLVSYGDAVVAHAASAAAPTASGRQT